MKTLPQCIWLRPPIGASCTKSRRSASMQTGLSHTHCSRNFMVGTGRAKMCKLYLLSHENPSTVYMTTASGWCVLHQKSTVSIHAAFSSRIIINKSKSCYSSKCFFTWLFVRNDWEMNTYCFVMRWDERWISENFKNMYFIWTMGLTKVGWRW